MCSLQGHVLEAFYSQTSAAHRQPATTRLIGYLLMQSGSEDSGPSGLTVAPVGLQHSQRKCQGYPLDFLTDCLISPDIYHLRRFLFDRQNRGWCRIQPQLRTKQAKLSNYALKYDVVHAFHFKSFTVFFSFIKADFVF